MTVDSSDAASRPLRHATQEGVARHLPRKRAGEEQGLAKFYSSPALLRGRWLGALACAETEGAQGRHSVVSQKGMI
jgi:hypothetical protein